MKCLDTLRTEHSWIASLLEALDRLVLKVEDEQVLPGRVANELMRLFQIFADGTHQQKEEDFLFAKLLEVGSRKDSQAIQGLLKDHGDERRRMLGMWSHMTSAAFGEPISVREFIRNARQYMRLHREHMQHENGVAFPMAERLLTESDDVAIQRGFEKIEQESSFPQLYERIRSTCQELGVSAPSSLNNECSQENPA